MKNNSTPRFAITQFPNGFYGVTDNGVTIAAGMTIHQAESWKQRLELRNAIGA